MHIMPQIDRIKWAALNRGVHVIRAFGVVTPVHYVPFRHFPAPVPGIAGEGHAQYGNNRQYRDGPVGGLKYIHSGGRCDWGAGWCPADEDCYFENVKWRRRV